MIRNVIRILSICALGALIVLSQPARAQVAFLIDGGDPRTDGGQVVGISLNSFGTTITSLGFYDHGGDGFLGGSYQVGLWDGSQNLVRTAIVDNSSPLTNGFRYTSIAPFTLNSPETFTIGALLPDNMQDVWLDDATLILWMGYSGAGTGQFSGPSGSLVYPSNFDDRAYFVVNANGPAPPFVPEPASVAMVGTAIVGLVAARRRR
jgi:hypothetical protein